MFGGPVRADRISYCPLDRVLTYKNLIYLLNLQFNQCSTELQDRMSQNISLLCSRINKGKAPKEVSGALNDLGDLMALHQRVSVAMGTSLQHLADNLFVHLSNLILLRRDSYLDFVKSGVKQDNSAATRSAKITRLSPTCDRCIIRWIGRH